MFLFIFSLLITTKSWPLNLKGKFWISSIFKISMTWRVIFKQHPSIIFWKPQQSFFKNMRWIISLKVFLRVEIIPSHSYSHYLLCHPSGKELYQPGSNTSFHSMVELLPAAGLQKSLLFWWKMLSRYHLTISSCLPENHFEEILGGQRQRMTHVCPEQHTGCRCQTTLC